MLFVRRGRRSDDDRIHRAVTQRRLRRTVRHRTGLAGKTGGAVGVLIDHVAELKVRMRGDVPGVHGPDGSAADDREAGHAPVALAPKEKGGGQEVEVQRAHDAPLRDYVGRTIGDAVPLEVETVDGGRPAQALGQLARLEHALSLPGSGRSFRAIRASLQHLVWFLGESGSNYEFPPGAISNSGGKLSTLAVRNGTAPGPAAEKLRGKKDLETSFVPRPKAPQATSAPYGTSVGRGSENRLRMHRAAA